MLPPTITPFQDRLKNGFLVALHKDDPLGKEPFPSRAIEVGAILHWAEKNRIALKTEFYLKTGENPEIVTYDYHPQMEKAPLRETQAKQTTTIEP